MKTSYPLKKYTFLFSLILLPLCVNTFATTSEEGQPGANPNNPQVEQVSNITSVNEVIYEAPVLESGQPTTTAQKADPPTKIVISNAVSWTILLSLSAAVYWPLVYKATSWQDSFSVRPMTGWFRWFYFSLAQASNQFFGYPANFKNNYFNVPITILILISPLCLSWMYHYIKIGLSSEGFHQWFTENIPGLEGYMKALFAHKDNKGEANSSLEYFLATLASFSIGTLFFFPPIVRALVRHDSQIPNYFLNATESFICGLLGIVFVPILLYLPTLIVGMPLGAVINYFRGVGKQPAAAPVNEPEIILAAPEVVVA